MKQRACLLLILLSAIQFSVTGTALTLYAGGDYYGYDERYDTLWNKSPDLYYNAGFGLDNIAGSGLSFHGDGFFANEYFDGITGASFRSPLQISTGYLDWRGIDGKLGLRLGRQLYTNLAVETFDVDGFKAEIHPNSKSIINVVAGITVPSPYTRLVRSQVASGDSIKDTLVSRMPPLLNNVPNQGLVMLDGSLNAIPFTTLTGAVAFVPKAFDKTWITSDTFKIFKTDNVTFADSVDTVTYDTTRETGDFRAALGANFSPIQQLRFNGSGRFSLLQKGIDRFDGRIAVSPTEALDVSAYIIGERGRVDSTNYFSVMFFKQLTEFGITLNAFPDGGGALQGDYHVIAVAGEGADHFFSFDGGNNYINGGLVFSAGWHGVTLRPHAGIDLPFLKFFSLVGSGEYARIDRTVTRRVYHYAVVTGGLKMAFHPIGLTIFPRVEYLTNRYYTNELRLLVTTKLLINRFWGTKS